MEELGLHDQSSAAGGPTHPIHLSTQKKPTVAQHLENTIFSTLSFEGRFRSYVDDYHKVIVPEGITNLLASGGVLAKSTDRHLLLFGKSHWEWYRRKTAEQIGIQPTHNIAARHILESFYRFDAPSADGTISMPSELANYAGISKDIVIVGLIFYAEIHDRSSYEAQSKDKAIRDRLDEFRQTRFNR